MGGGRIKSEVEGEQKKLKDGIALGKKVQDQCQAEIITDYNSSSELFPLLHIICGGHTLPAAGTAPVDTSEQWMPVNIAQLGVLKSQIPPQPSLHGEDKHTAI